MAGCDPSVQRAHGRALREDGSVRDPLVLGLLLALLVAVLAWAVAAWGWRHTARTPGSRSRRRNRAALEGERAAEALLVAHGYHVVARQERALGFVHVDGEEHTFEVRADLVVTREGGRFVAEVKTGATAPDPLHPATRRQLLEYALVFDLDGVLLVDVGAGTVREVDFAPLWER